MCKDCSCNTLKYEEKGFSSKDECAAGKVLCDAGCGGCRLTKANEIAAALAKPADPLDEMLHLPIGRSQFMEFTDKVIKYSEVEADHDGMRFALADAIVHLPPGKSMEKLGYFVHLLRKIAVNQTCVMMRTELHDECKRRIAEEEAKAKASAGEPEGAINAS